MNPDKKRNTGHSVFQRLLNHARTRGEDFNLLLFRYGIERLLYRLSISSHADKYILKGASLFLAWKGQNYRVTKDADLLGSDPSNAEHITGVFRELCHATIEDDDGIEFMPDTVHAVPIRDEQAYDGIRVTLVAMLYQAKISLQVDIGFGDVITPGPEWIEFPTLLGTPPPQLLAYPRYTMVAEKFEAMVRLGMANRAGCLNSTAEHSAMPYETPSDGARRRCPTGCRWRSQMNSVRIRRNVPNGGHLFGNLNRKMCMVTSMPLSGMLQLF